MKPFLGIDVSGDYVYIPIVDCMRRMIVPDLGEFDLIRDKVGWLKCDKGTGIWQHFAVSDTLINIMEEKLKIIILSMKTMCSSQPTQKTLTIQLAILSSIGQLMARWWKR